MAQGILHNLDVHTCFAHSRGEGVPQGVTAKVWKQNRIFLALLEYFIVAVPDNPADGLVQRSLIEGAAVTVEEDKIRVSVNGHLALQSYKLLVLPLHEKRFLYESQHRHLPLACFRLGGMDIEVASLLAGGISVIIVHQGVIDVNDSFLQVNVAPPQSCQLPYPQSGSHHHSEDGIPVIVDGMVLQEVQQEFLLRLGQASAFSVLKIWDCFSSFRTPSEGLLRM